MNMADTPTAATDRISITRTFPVCREEVFAAWTDPDHVAEWYGPATMSAPREGIRIDLRTGGRYELTMVGADREFAIGLTITELDAPALLELRSDPYPEMGMVEPTFWRIELHDDDGATRMVFADGPFPSSASEYAAVGWNAAFDKLDAYLVAPESSDSNVSKKPL